MGDNVLPHDVCTVVGNFPLRTARSSQWEKGLIGFSVVWRKNIRVRKSQSWDRLWNGNTEVLAAEGGGIVIWMRLALAYFLLFRASGLLAYESGMTHPDDCLVRRDLTCFRGVRR